MDTMVRCELLTNWQYQAISIIATIMAYGQTGAGKTFTMTGDTGNYRLRGIIPRAISQVTLSV